MLKYLKSESVFMTALLANVPRKVMNRAKSDDKIRFWYFIPHEMPDMTITFQVFQLKLCA